MLAVALMMATLALAADAVDVGRFSTLAPGTAIGDGWRPLTFPRVERHTQYALARDDGTVVVRADADASASGLIRPLDVDLADTPRLEWRWKIADVVTEGDPYRKAGDDYAARIYVAFRYDPARVSFFNRVKYELLRIVYGEYPPHAGIAYVWDARVPAGTVIVNAYTERVRMVVVRSGGADAGRWVAESRNVLEDYRRAFGEEPPRVSGVALMTDTDDTASRATAWYGDIRFVKR
jgi:hypothetical protein